MANIGRKTAVMTALTMVLIFREAAGQTGPSEAAEPNAVTRSTNRVRSDEPYIRRMIAEAERRSPSCRALLATIGRTDGLVYVEHGRCGRGVRACLVMWVTTAGPYRLLRVRLEAQKSDDDAIAKLGHELRHAVEILSEPAITSAAEMYSFYKRFGSWVGDASFETRAAVAAGDAIRQELSRAPRDREADTK